MATAKKNKDNAKKIKITLVKSTIGCSEKQKGTVEALGLKKIRQSRIHDDTPVTQGMLFIVKHLVKIEEV